MVGGGPRRSTWRRSSACPCLSILANVCGIPAGGIFMFFSTHLTLGLYVRDVMNTIQLRDAIGGLIAPTRSGRRKW